MYTMNISEAKILLSAVVGSGKTAFSDEECSYVAKNFSELLTETEQKVLLERLGISDGNVKSQEKTAKILGLSGEEKVRVLEMRAIRKLRHPERTRHLLRG